MKKLTKKREIFATEYVKLDDASAAYRIAYSASKMKDTTIHNNAYKLLKNNDVATRIKDLQKIAAEVAEKEFKVDSKEITRHLNILRKARIDEYVEFIEKDIDGKKQRVLQFKTFDKLTEEQLMCIESIKETRYGIELKLHSKEWTIEKINRHIGYYEKDNSQKVIPPRQVIDYKDYKEEIDN